MQGFCTLFYYLKSKIFWGVLIVGLCFAGSCQRGSANSANSQNYCLNATGGVYSLDWADQQETQYGGLHVTTSHGAVLESNTPTHLSAIATYKILNYLVQTAHIPCAVQAVYQSVP